jgi:apolipoprotein N-acyltransferase
MKADPKKHATFIMQKYTDLTRQALEDHPDLVVWPEAATPGFVLKNMSLHQEITSLIKESKTHFIIGSSEYPKFVKPSSSNSKGIGNTALFFSPEGKVVGQYLKIHLVPFGEYVPYEGTIPWPGFVIPEGKRSYEIPGKEFTLFGIDGTKFGVIVCWEIVFPDLFREFVKRGANFMINITNEGWFGETAAPYQMLMVNVFRAVENRIAVARAANTGISCFIDPYGRIDGRVSTNNKDIFVEGYLTSQVPLAHEKTFYTIYGDIFVYVIFSFAVLMIALTFSRRKK